MLSLLRKSCKQCTESSIKTYAVNIKALAKLAGLQEAPGSSGWINKALLEKVRKLPLHQYKRLSIAGVKALNAYGKRSDDWHQAMTDSTKKYGARRDTQKRTPREAENWPKGGYSALRKLAHTLQEEVEPLFARKPTNVSRAQLYEMQRQFVILFYAHHALRGDLGDVRITKKGQNYIYKTGASWNVHVGQHKTVRSRGAIDIRLDKPVSEALSRLLPYVRANTDHGFLLSTKRSGGKLSRKDMLIMLRTTTEERIGKRLGVQMIRVLKTTGALESIDKAVELQRELGHGAGMQRRYVSRS